MTAACRGLAAAVYAVPAAPTWPQAIPPPGVMGALAGLALICTALAFILYFRLIAEGEQPCAQIPPWPHSPRDVQLPGPACRELVVHQVPDDWG